MQSMKSAMATLALACAISAPTEARLTRIVITSQQVIAGGAAFGAAGPFEKLTGTAYFEADPRNRHNEVVFDLDKAARNAAGKVEFPAGKITTTLCNGISSSGMYYRDYLYQGFNEDEQGRQVCQGVHIDIPGVQKLFLNYRFAQPNPFTVQHRERYVPDDNFPRAYAVRENPLFGGDEDDRDGATDEAGPRDGILKRPHTDPKVIHTDSATEWWQFRSSLVDTNEDGTRDIHQPQNVRRYEFSGTQHFVAKGVTPTFGTGNRQCQQLSNPTHYGASARALIVALEDWVRHGWSPPPSRVARIADGTLVPQDQASTSPA